MSVIVPAFQSSGHIRDALHALRNQRTEIPFEVIVVDSSSDGTDGIVAREFPEFRLLHFPDRRHVGEARNLGVEAARSDVILFVDSDTIPSPRWLDHLYHALVDSHADGVCGSMVNGTPTSVTGSMGFYLEFFRWVACRSRPRRIRFLLGGNSGFRRSLLTSHHYTNQSVGEDMLFSSKLAAEGKRLLFIPQAAIVHKNRTGWRTVLAYQRILGRGAYFYRKHDVPRVIGMLEAAPWVAFLAPGVVPVAVALTLCRGLLFIDLLRFLFALPAVIAGSTAWALGLHEELVNARRSR